MCAGGEVLAEALPDTYVFKAFNSVGSEMLGDAERLMGEPITMLYAGPEEKKEVAAGVIEQVGFVPSYVGPIRYARNLEVRASQRLPMRQQQRGAIWEPMCHQWGAWSLCRVVLGAVGRCGHCIFVPLMPCVSFAAQLMLHCQRRPSPISPSPSRVQNATS
jgi:hypothetical protein